MKSSTKTALVTGAAARIGATIATTLHQRGCNVLVHYNSNAAGAEELVGRLNAERAGSASAVAADLSQSAGVEQLVSHCAEHFDALDVLVNNASRFYPTPVGETLEYQWEDLFNSNLRGPYFLCQGLLGPLRAASGCIVNIVDVHAERPMDGHSVYSMSKAGIAAMTRSLARELGPEVRVNGVAPGAILWPEHESSVEHRQNILDRTALQRLGEPADIASAVAYLALDAPYVTGQILAVDGGRSLNI